MNTCIIYARTAHAPQSEANYGMQLQIAKCQEYAATRSWSIANIFVDEGIPGNTLNRRGFQNALTHLEQHPDIKFFVVYDLARLARVLDLLRELIANITASGVEIRIVKEMQGVDVRLLVPLLGMREASHLRPTVPAKRATTRR